MHDCQTAATGSYSFTRLAPSGPPSPESRATFRDFFMPNYAACMMTGIWATRGLMSCLYNSWLTQTLLGLGFGHAWGRGCHDHQHAFSADVGRGADDPIVKFSSCRTLWSLAHLPRRVAGTYIYIAGSWRLRCDDRWYLLQLQVTSNVHVSREYASYDGLQDVVGGGSLCG